ncbi:SDR family NAD(P)-dependent oxidoreductase [Conexibacter sp. CPCC 206217]|uniref:SDR family NAD(P)-dependent oxidoreductase n=1 Tax=Conexibacter sp. CPCC 206217 TaxID=3064574 RepID=UPI0027271587|nr:SDR family oxidoreductase [Conexibacter sp. CPCC 206217]MDO8209609.1 SDR family oxidoreductase [Conexibacter sp. CPCC 206217]
MLGKQGKLAVVTGGSNGIGQAFCERLAQDGARVAILDIAGGAETEELCRAAGGDATAIETDITSPEAVAAAAARIGEELGSVDILVHSAGIYPNTPFVELDFEEWRRVLTTNLDSLFHLGKAFVPGMIERRYGRIVSVASTTFHTGFPGFTHYTASKGGIIGFTRCLAEEVGEDGVTVNAIAPSVVRTKTTESGVQASKDFFGQISQQQAIKRPELPADLVGALSFLTSDDSAFITGQTLVVDGGWVRA